MGKKKIKIISRASEQTLHNGSRHLYAHTRRNSHTQKTDYKHTSVKPFPFKGHTQRQFKDSWCVPTLHSQVCVCGAVEKRSPSPMVSAQTEVKGSSFSASQAKAT